MPLSKTKIIAGLQCQKQLHLRVHHPEWATTKPSPASITGLVVENHARMHFPNGILVERDKPGKDPFTRTRDLIESPSVTCLFEAAFRSNDLQVFVDVLSRNGSGWTLTEIKASTSVKAKHVDDVAVQAVALQQAGIKVNKYELMHINSHFIYQGDHDYTALFVREDITEQVNSHTGFIEAQLEPFKKLIKGPQPERHIGSYCNKPYPCPYKTYCEAHDADYPVAYLPNGWHIAQQLQAQGIFDIRDIPVDSLNSAIHLWIRRVTKEGRAELKPDARQILSQLNHPRYYLDFECIQFAIPIWGGTHPFEQLPFQFSCHVQINTGRLEHKSFLDTSGQDPRRAFAEALISACGESGPIIVYYQAFEKSVISGLIQLFPDLAGRLQAIHDRIFDLLPVLKQNYYHPDMKGSWSIKKVLPCLVPELSYASLGSVQDGTQAQAIYFAVINGSLDETAKEAGLADLLDYCKLDTLAMVRIIEKICNSM
ncbi:MAG: DUF2779 domain-containing protein [Thiohalomonadales bacterium]|nr:DUF2779 domain-containing protein [Thiohalomonadales bacterium]